MARSYGDERLLSWVYLEPLRGERVNGYGVEGLPVSTSEQGFADIFSFSPDPISHAIDLLWNLEKVNLDSVYDRCSNERCQGYSSRPSLNVPYSNG